MFLFQTLCHAVPIVNHFVVTALDFFQLVHLVAQTSEFSQFLIFGLQRFIQVCYLLIGVVQLFLEVLDLH